MQISSAIPIIFTDGGLRPVLWGWESGASAPGHSEETAGPRLDLLFSVSSSSRGYFKALLLLPGTVPWDSSVGLELLLRPGGWGRRGAGSKAVGSLFHFS